AASRAAADDLARMITAAQGASFGVHRASLMQLAMRCAAAEMAMRGLTPTTGLGAEALAARVTYEAMRERGVPYFTPVARYPGFAGALAATLGELRLAAVGPATLDKADTPATDVGELLRRFEVQLEDARLADRTALLRLAARALGDGTLGVLRRMPMLLLDVAIAEPAVGAFVEALTGASPNVLVTIPAGDDATMRTVDDIAARRGARVAGATASRDPDESDLGRARVFLFAPAAPPARAPTGEVLFFSAPGEARETVEIARRILDEARTGIRFDEMAVLLRAPELYASLLQAALERAGVPAYFTRGSARPDPSGRAFLALLECAVEELSARRFAEYLSLGQVPPLDAAGAPPADRAVWTPSDDETLFPLTDAP